MAKKYLVIVLSIWFLPALLYAEDQARVDTLTYILSEIQVQAARDMVTEADAPFSVFVRTRTPLEQNLEPGTSFAHLASGVPGLWINDRHNDALGERMSIRGMGWRAAFGVRGIQVLMDDIPLTVPDGQTVMDIVDPSMIQQMEIIRGPSSSFWGNASGGTLFLSTRPASFEPLMRVRLYGGSHGTYHGLASGTWLRDQRRYHVSASYLERDGFRDHSGHSILRLSGSMEWNLSQESTLQFTGAFVDAPDTRHPGALTLDEINTDRTKAADAFKNASAGKSWRQGQVGVRLQSETGAGLIRAGVYGISRSLHNPLPFADIEVDRWVAGSRISLERQAESWWTWAVGVDASIQSDNRVNYAYAEDDFNRADRTIDQRETVLNGAGYVRAGT
ncbi:TonB-dependent receptor plug domain-containing protein, partial [Balneolaceae bacterium ANBcel3]|nr:TonB-dependent receptor plug domain-containing protein [Balneolaceae bacterium ANBcel3]